MRGEPGREKGGRVPPPAGVVGVIGGPFQGLSDELRELKKLGMEAVEIRADLFSEPREALGVLSSLPAGLKALFTIRKSSQGGRFSGAESARVALFLEALSGGASWIDIEWGSEALEALRGAPLIVSHHDFGGTPEPPELERLGERMAQVSCAAIKLVPMARGLADVAVILRWIGARGAAAPPRIGFAMGEAGFPSRVLAIAQGSPLTYGSLGRAVAPGQVSARELLSIYRPAALDRGTRVLGVIGNPVAHSLSPHIHNPALAARGLDKVYLPILVQRFDELGPALDDLPIDGLSVTIPWKEEALRAADRADSQSRGAGAANTLKVERGPDGRRRALHAFNTDFEGVLGPLRRRGIELRGLRAAVIGNGGAARAAVGALLEAGASPTLYYRNVERGRPVADSLGVPGRALAEIASDSVSLIINATPLGMKDEDPSPIARAAFGAARVAFDMVYGPRRTPFLEEARAAGAALIEGREMLVSQAVEQFRIFTGEAASYEELEAGFERGQALRRPPGAQDPGT